MNHAELKTRPCQRNERDRLLMATLRGPPFNLQGGMGGWIFFLGQMVYFNPA